MHITITAVGSRGDVQPFVALGLGLQAHGHRVRIATHCIHAPMITGNGMDFASIEGNPRELLEGHIGQAWLKSGSNPLKFWRQYRKLAEKTVEKGLSDSLEACRGTDAVIYTFMGAGGYHVAEMMGVPHLMAVLQPLTRTREAPCIAVPSLSLGRTYNWWTHLLTEQVAWQAGRSWVNRWRKESLGLDPIPLRGVFSRFYADAEPFIYGFSEHVVPRPRDWPATHEITGYWFLDGQNSWSPPPGLLDFLSSGPKPVYIGFGSMAGQVAEELMDISIKAVTLAKQRAILLGGWATTVDRDLPDTVFAMDAAPHDWLFPQMAAVVHHGGAGTVAAGLRAGRPTLVVPFFGDQPYWGKRVHDLGAGPKPLPRKRLSGRKLAEAIVQAVSDPEIKRRTALLADKIQVENGVKNAVERVIKYLDR